MWQTSCASLNALILEIHLAEKYRNTLFQTEDNVVQILFTSVSKATINEQRKKSDNTPAYQASRRAFHVLSQIQASVNQRFGLGSLEHAWPSPPRASVYGAHCVPTLTDTEA